MQPYDAIVLAGGAGSRLGGVDKAALPLAGAPLVAASFAAVRDARHLVVVGATDAPLPPGATLVREDPPGGGPAAAIVAGIAELAHLSATSAACPDRSDGQPAWVVVLGCDLPGAAGAVPRLLAASTGDGAIAIDPDGRRQWVLGSYAWSALVEAAAVLGDAHGKPLRALLGELDLREVSVGDDWRDLDTWQDHSDWTDRLQRRRTR